MEQNKKLKWERIKQAIKQLMTWKILISLLIAWALFMGWAILFVLFGIWFDNTWLISIGGGFVGWVLLPNGTFMIPTIIMMPIVHKILFGRKPNIDINKGENK